MGWKKGGDSFVEIHSNEQNGELETFDVKEIEGHGRLRVSPTQECIDNSGASFNCLVVNFLDKNATGCGLIFSSLPTSGKLCPSSICSITPFRPCGYERIVTVISRA